MKKTICLLLSLVMFFSITSGIDLYAYAQTYSGSCGENVTWELDTDTGVLTISGNGNMADYSPYNAPWDGQRCDVKIVDIKYGVTSIGYSAFFDCINLTNVAISDSVTSIGFYAFDNCISLISVIIPNSVTSIGFYAFRNCSSLTSVTIPDSVTSIGDFAFANCDSLTNVTIPNNITSVSGTFDGCINLTSVTIPNGLTSIDYATFRCCTSLTSITIPNSVTVISESAFKFCDNLKDVYYLGTKEQWKNISVADYNSDLLNANIHYLSDATSACNKHTWNNGVITKSATCKATGVKTYTCNVCGETKTEVIPKKAHTYKTTTTKATTSKNGSIVTKCTVCGYIKIKSTIYYPKTITLSATSYTYNGKVKKPGVTVKDSKGNKIAASNYTVSYASGRKNVGKYTVKITFKGNYSGTVTKAFTIKPKSTSLSKLTADKKKFTVKWKKQATQTTGYEIQYATDSKFTKNKKNVTVSKNGTTSKTISKLSANKKYYVRVRTYKTVKINGKNTKLYSSWSKAKTVTTKKQ